MKKCFCLLLAGLLCLSVPGAFAEGAADPLAEAFDGSAAIVLEEETWPGLPDEEALGDTALGFIDLSPDGKTMLCVQGARSVDLEIPEYHLSLIRGGEIIPVAVNAGRGDGDPYGKLASIGTLLRELPGAEGVSWSADGRWCTFSDVGQIMDGRSKQVLDGSATPRLPGPGCWSCRLPSPSREETAP